MKTVEVDLKSDFKIRLFSTTEDLTETVLDIAVMH